MDLLQDDSAALVIMDDCVIGDPLSPALRSVSWRLMPGECWVVAGPSGGGKEAFAAALSGFLLVRPKHGGSYRNDLAAGAAVVSFEAAAALVMRERRDDDSDFVEGGVSEGRTVRSYLAAVLPAADAAAGTAAGLGGHPLVEACGVLSVLDRGLKRLSTGEWRRTLLCSALLSRPAILVIVEPYEGLDAASRGRLSATLESIAGACVRGDAGAPVLVVVDRVERAPASANRVVKLSGSRIAFSGPRRDYVEASHGDFQPAPSLPGDGASGDGASGPAGGSSGRAGEALVELRDVTVGWSGRKVLDSLSWTVRRGEHWLVRGPNGSGKTTLLELITGDNPQAYREDVTVFGRRRGSGQTVWELKSRMGLVSYRLHLEYRYLDESPLEDVLVSGLHDSIGLYAEPSDSERALAGRWLAGTGFAGRSRVRFGSLSFGEQRALLVARAAIKAPELLVLDEPCHGLDDGQRRFVLDLMAGIAARGESTMIHVTHDPDEVQSFENRVLELRPGSSPSWAVVPACTSHRPPEPSVWDQCFAGTEAP